MVTIKEIANRCGVSRGTVDRVLNCRGNVKPEKAELIRRVAAELNYRPNQAGKALRANNQKTIVSIILTAIGNPFFDDVIAGIKQATSEVCDFGIEVQVIKIKGYNPQVQLQALREIKTNRLVIFNPINTPEIRQEIAELKTRGIDTIHINTDLEPAASETVNTGVEQIDDSETTELVVRPRLCYIGCDYYQNGRTAANLLGLMLPEEQKAQILLVTGSNSISNHGQRVQGFTDYITENFPNLTIGDVIEGQDDDQTTYVRTKEALKQADYAAIYVVAAGTLGVCKAVQESADKYKIVCSDATKTSVEYLGKGLIQGVVCQQPYQQGYQAVKMAHRYITFNQKPKGDFITENEIKLITNIGG